MLYKEIGKLWRNGFIGISVLLMLSVTGCNDKPKNVSRVTETQNTAQTNKQDTEEDAGELINSVIDLYEGAVKENKTQDLETIRCIVKRFGENGYPAVDRLNQINMVQAEQVEKFFDKVKAKEDAKISIIQVDYQGDFIKFDINSKDGNIDVVRKHYKYEKGTMIKKDTASYQPETWKYTEEGYLMFSGSWFSDELYCFELSSADEQIALRVQPIEEKYRQLNRKYLIPITYEKNNMFLVNWSEDDFGELDFYDMYDIIYKLETGEDVPYVADDNLGVGKIYHIPKEEFESRIMKYFKIDSKTLQSKTTYDSETSTYEYKPRGFYEIEYPEYPYSEVAGYTENDNGTITLTVNVVFPHVGNSKEYVHEVVVRPLEDGGIQYVSNRITSSEPKDYKRWHTSRLNEDEWEKMYGGS